MLYARDFRAKARDALRGNWFIAVIAGIIIAIIGGNNTIAPQISIDATSDNETVIFSFFGREIMSFNADITATFEVLTPTTLILLFVLLIIVAIISATIIATVNIGYARFNLDMVDSGNAELGSLLSYFRGQYMKNALCANLLMALKTVLWMLLFIIPGIVASYSYAATYYVLAEHPEWSASKAIRRSKYIMKGNRWRLFCLQFSFFGWALLAALTFNIGYLWLNPYMATAQAAFFRDVKEKFEIDRVRVWEIEPEL